MPTGVYERTKAHKAAFVERMRIGRKKAKRAKRAKPREPKMPTYPRPKMAELVSLAENRRAIARDILGEQNEMEGLYEPVNVPIPAVEYNRVVNLLQEAKQEIEKQRRLLVSLNRDWGILAAVINGRERD